MTRPKQYKKFLSMVEKLLTFAIINGYAIRLGEAHRPKFVAERYSKQGKGIIRSKHRWSLAIDIWVYDKKTGKRILWKSPVYEKLGLFWEHMGGTWGGRWKRKDNPHFEYPEKPA